MIDAKADKEQTIPHATRYDGLKTSIYVVTGIVIAISLLAGTVWLFIAGQ